VATTVNVDHLSFSAPQTGLQVNESYRDPQLRAFEQYLLSNMRQTDVTTDHEGIYLFNVNQVAYLAEGCMTSNEQRATRTRVNDALHVLSYVIKRVPTGNKGVCQVFHQLRGLESVRKLFSDGF
jgi:hypothetical protein